MTTLSSAKTVEEVVEAIHASATQLVLYVTGGGSRAISDLLCVPGASRTVLEARVPYSRASLAEIIGKQPEQYVSEEMALSMARAAYRRAAELSKLGDTLIGVGCTATLRTGTPKKGSHRFFIACKTSTGTYSYTMQLEKGARSRVEEENVVANSALCVILQHCGVSHTVPDKQAFIGAFASEELSEISAPDTNADDPLQALLDGRVACVEIVGDVMTMDAPRRNGVYLSGSFNPLHEGHMQLLNAACEVLGRPGEGCFELCVDNADKGKLEIAEVRRRVEQFRTAKLPIVLTRAPLFTQKVELLRGATFVLGYDTAVRIVMEKYYDNSERAMELLFAQLKWAGSRFVVGGRLDAATGKFLTLADIRVPECLQRLDLFQEIPEAAFRNDISSTEIRRRMAGA